MAIVFARRLGFDTGHDPYPDVEISILDRRAFLKSTTAAAAASAAVAPRSVSDAAADTATRSVAAPSPAASPAVHAGTRDLVLAMPWPDSVSGPADQAFRIARRLEAALDGRWRITTRHHAHGGLEAVMTAEADLYMGTENHNLSYHPAFAYFAALPGAGVFNADDLTAWLSIGGGQEHWDNLAAEFNVKPFLAGHLGRWPGLWSTRPIDSLADLAGQRVAVQGLARDVMRGIGAEPVHVPATELAAALRSGDIAAAEYGGPLTSLALGLPTAAPHINGFGILEGGISLSLGIRRSLWDRLGNADRTVIAAVAAESAQLSIAEMRAHEKPLRALIRDQYGVAFRPLPSDAAIAIDRVAEAVVALTASHDEIARRIDRSYHGFRDAAWGLDGGARLPEIS